MAFEREKNKDEMSTGGKILTGLGVLGAIGLAGYAAYKLFEDDKKEEDTPKPKDSQKYRSSNKDAYTRNQCILCDLNICDDAKKLSCDHVIHPDCLRTLIVNGSTKCPKCLSKLNDEDLYCINKSVINNRANQQNLNHTRSGPGRSAGYSGIGDQSDLDNHSNQLNPNNQNFQSRTSRKYNYQY